jgi:catenin alpha
VHIIFIGRGPLQTTMAVINAAKRISEAGTKLDKLARAIADQVRKTSPDMEVLR